MCAAAPWHESLRARLSARPWLLACAWLGLLAPLFVVTYQGALEIVSWRTHVPSIVFAWERYIPFLAWTVVPYWSIDALYGLSLFLCRERQELNTHGRRLLSAQLIATPIFVIAPLRATATFPADTGIFAPWFAALGMFDKPFNQAPSLHIALLVILWAAYWKWVPRGWHWLMHMWAMLIGISVLTTNQHHFFDVPTAVLLGVFCLWLWPDTQPSPLASWALTRDARRVCLAAAYGSGAIVCGVTASRVGGAALWLWWPAVSLGVVALAYAGLGVAVFQKSGDGHQSIASRLMLWPYQLGARVNAWAWTRRIAPQVDVAEGVSVGRYPVFVPPDVSVIDMTAEFTARRSAAWFAFPQLDLVTPEPLVLAAAAARIDAEREKGRRVLVSCALGYSRSVAVIAVWLLRRGLARDAVEAVGLVRRMRPGIVVNVDTLAAIDAARRRHGGYGVMTGGRHQAVSASATTAALLAQGRVLHGLALALFLAVAMLTASRSGAVSIWCCAAALPALLAESYFAMRVGFDAALFKCLATEAEPDLSALDASLACAGLRAMPETTRPLRVRIAGAQRLFVLQGGTVAALALILFVAVGLT